MSRRLFGYFLGLFLPSAALVAGAAFVVHRAQVTRQVEIIELRETLDTQRGARDLREFVGARTRDVLFLRSLPSMRAALADDSASSLGALQRMFVAALESKTDIDRIRWIDETGRERSRVARVGTGIAATSPDGLQDKRLRYFVQEAEALAPGQVYVSPLDLSMDYGVVERPYKPVVRLGTPLVDANGRRRGLLLVNYRAVELLRSFDESTRGLYGRSMVLNGLGQRLHVQTAEGDTWRFMFGERDSFATQRPNVWRAIARSSAGQHRDDQGIWTFETVYPLQTAARYAGSATVPSRGLSGAAHDWKVVSFVPSSDIGAALRSSLYLVLGVASLLLVLGAFGSFIVARAWVRRDAAELERAQREARESEAALRLVLQSNPNAMMVVDRSGRVFDWNPQAERVFGYSRAEMRELKVEDFVPEAARGMHQRYREDYADRAQARPMGQGLDLSARRRDGAEFPVEISLAPLTLSGESYVVATIVDISARKQAEAQVRELAATLERRVEQRTEELARAESNLRLILESSANGLFGVDLSGRITFANPAACRMLGYGATELIGRAAASLGAATGSGEGFGLHLGRTLQDGVGASVDNEAYRHANGAAMPVMYSTHPMIRGGRIIGAVVNFIDATERRALDAAREAALREAERLAQARSDFLANMSHEIRTPLNGVLGLAQVAYRESPCDAATRETFARILEAGRTLLGVVDNVLDFSRIEAGKVQVEAITTDLAPLLDEVLASIVPVAQAKGVAVRVERAASAPTRCVTDPMRVKQVLLNLLSNAVKFTERGEVVLLVERLGEQLRFEVRDTGIGISPEQAARIFSAFEQADTSTTRRFGGTGLGLAICKRITELLGGQISVRSEVGVGSAFSVLLPYVEPAPDAVDPSAALDASISGSRRVARLEGLRILLAEDNEVNQMVVLAMLRKEAPVMTTVGDGQQAVDKVREAGPGAFDLVLMDIQMPGMDGYEATRRIHEIDPDLPVVGQTAHVLHEAIEQCLAAGMVAHLPKPIDRHDLIATIIRHARLPDQFDAGNSAISA